MAETPFKKAVIKILKGSNEGKEVYVLFNPTEYSHTVGNKFAEKTLPGLSSPVVQFVNGETQSLSMDLLFDTWTDKGEKDLPAYLEEFKKMITIDGHLHAPPPVEFKWGKFIFQAYVEKLNQKFTMFDESGTPVRATISVSFKGYQTIQNQLSSPRRNSSDKTKSRVFVAGDSLWTIAASEYGEPRFWRVIASHNRIENPRLLQPGQVLQLPPLDENSAFWSVNGA